MRCFRLAGARRTAHIALKDDAPSCAELEKSEHLQEIVSPMVVRLTDGREIDLGPGFVVEVSKEEYELCAKDPKALIIPVPDPEGQR